MGLTCADSIPFNGIYVSNFYVCFSRESLFMTKQMDGTWDIQLTVVVYKDITKQYDPFYSERTAFNLTAGEMNTLFDSIYSKIITRLGIQNYNVE